MSVRLRAFSIVVCINFFINMGFCCAQTLTDVTNYFLARFAELDKRWSDRLQQRKPWYTQESRLLDFYRALFEEMDCFGPEVASVASDTGWIDGDLSQPSASLASISSKPTVPKELSAWFIEQILVEPESLVAVVSDLRGDLHALLRTLWVLAGNGWMNDELVLKSNARIVFSGNYSGGSPYGIEVWYILLLLQHKNPYNVFLIKGACEAQIASPGSVAERLWENIRCEECKIEGGSDIRFILSRIIEYCDTLPVGILCRPRSSDGRMSEGMLVTSAGVPLGVDGHVSDAGFQFHRIGRRDVCAITQNQALNCMRMNGLDDPDSFARMVEWIGVVKDSDGRCAIDMLVTGGAYLRGETHITFRVEKSDLLLPSLSSSDPALLVRQLVFSTDARRFYPILQVSSVVRLPGMVKQESLIIWSAHDKSVRCIPKVLNWPVGYGRYVPSHAGTLGYRYVWQERPSDEGAVPERLRGLISHRKFATEVILPTWADNN